MLVGKTVVLVRPQPEGSELELEALVLELVPDPEHTVPRMAANLAFCSPVTTDVTPFGRALMTIKSVPHESCREVGPLAGGEYWRERGGEA